MTAVAGSEPIDALVALAELEAELGRAEQDESSRSRRAAAERVVERTERAVLLLDDLGTIVSASRAAAASLGFERAASAGLLVGEALRCTNSLSREGCGRSRGCGACELRSALALCLRSGKNVVGRVSEISVSTPSGLQRRALSVSALLVDPGERLVLALIGDAQQLA